jgi:DNA-binding transcriptional regulator YdaS (Cro superfamily)
MTDRELRSLLRAAIKTAGSQRAFAQLCGVTPPYLTDVLKGRRTMGPKILKQLGLERFSGVRTIA